MNQAQLTPKQLDILAILRGSEVPMTAKQIGEQARAWELEWIDWTPQGIADSLKRLIPRGLAFEHGVPHRVRFYFGEEYQQPLAERGVALFIDQQERNKKKRAGWLKAAATRKNTRKSHNRSRYDRWALTWDGLISLDAPVAPVVSKTTPRISRGGSLTTFGEIVVTNDGDPIHELLSDELLRIVGDRTLDDLARLPADEARRLQERVLAAGIAPPAVQRTERDRLSEVTPHRGTGAGPREHDAMSSGRGRTRKQQSASHKSRSRRFKRREKKSTREGWEGYAT